MARTARSAAGALALLVALTGCGADAGDGGGGSAGTPPAGPGLSPGSSPGPSAGGPGTFTNPVYAENFPDPGVLRVGDTYHVYGTNTSAENVPTMTSTDLVTWADGPDALPDVGTWAVGGNTWAPEVLAAGGRYLLYYTARSISTGKQCIGRAVATAPTGPFADPDPGPLVCEAAEGGSIDASPFRDTDGRLYLYWKNDGNCCAKPVRLYGQALSADGMRLTGRRATLLTNTKPWQGNLVEAPQMVRRGKTHVLFYSANAYDTDRYAMGYAGCRGALGPCADAGEPVLRSSDSAAGPGHGYVVTTPEGGTWIIYHAWQPQTIGSVSPGRQLWLDEVEWTGDRPVVRGPTADPQPAP